MLPAPFLVELGRSWFPFLKLLVHPFVVLAHFPMSFKGLLFGFAFVLNNTLTNNVLQHRTVLHQGKCFEGDIRVIPRFAARERPVAQWRLTT